MAETRGPSKRRAARRAAVAFFFQLLGAHRSFMDGHADGMSAARDRLIDAHRAFMAEQGYRERLIVAGPRLADDGAAWASSALAIELPARDAAEAMAAGDPPVQAGLYERVEIHRWEFGGRR
jgi:uncharacterized protein YciI